MMLGCSEGGVNETLRQGYLRSNSKLLICFMAGKRKDLVGA